MTARDADVRGGDSWQVDYCLESGNEEEVFKLATDRQTNEVSLVLTKVTSCFANSTKSHRKFVTTEINQNSLVLQFNKE